jgi:hypothetical protein
MNVPDPFSDLPAPRAEPPTAVPRSILEQRLGVRKILIVLTGYRAGTKEPATIETTYGEWVALEPVRRVVKEELKRRKIPLRSRSSVLNWTRERSEVLNAWIESREDEEWVVIRGRRKDSEELATIEMTFGQWRSLMAVQAMVREDLDQRRWAREIWGRKPRG